MLNVVGEVETSMTVISLQLLAEEQLFTTPRLGADLTVTSPLIANVVPEWNSAPLTHATRAASSAPRGTDAQTSHHHRKGNHQRCGRQRQPDRDDQHDCRTALALGREPDRPRQHGHPQVEHRR